MSDIFYYRVMTCVNTQRVSHAAQRVYKRDGYWSGFVHCRETVLCATNYNIATSARSLSQHLTQVSKVLEHLHINHR